MLLTFISLSSEPWYAYIPFVLFTLATLFFWLARGAVLVLAILALVKYLRDKKEERKDSAVKKSLGEVLKTHRQSCSMTQEFVAEVMGVTRQAVSKWENGTSDPSTSNLLKLAKLYGISPEALIREIQLPEN